MLFLRTTKKRLNPRLVIVVIIVAVIILFEGYFYPNPDFSVSFNPKQSFCDYNVNWTDGNSLLNVAENLKLRSRNSSKNIFFHETSCRKDGIVGLNSRQSCAIESAG